MAAFLALMSALAVQLFNLQIVRAQELQERARRQWTSEAVIAPRRGSILDRNGTPLAVSATSYTACVSPRQVKDVQAFSRVLAPVLDLEENDIAKKASDTGKGSVILKRKLSRETAQTVKTLYARCRESGDDSLSGLYLEEDSSRYYPMGAFATQLLGLTTIDGVGQAGLEKSLDKYLSGRSGFSLTEVDGRGRALSDGAQEYIDAVDGGDVTLTMDWRQPCEAFGGKTSFEVAEEAYRLHASQPQPRNGKPSLYYVAPEKDENSSFIYTLIYSTVGDDVVGGDMFENVN